MSNRRLPKKGEGPPNEVARLLALHIISTVLKANAKISDIHTVFELINQTIEPFIYMTAADVKSAFVVVDQVLTKLKLDPDDRVADGLKRWKPSGT
jgi:hypothetical protein